MSPREGNPDQATTKQRILDIALELFIEKGYDKTSLREIAERLGFSKAAVYYHFASKDDILAALHLRLHAVLDNALVGLAQTDAGLDAWPALLDQFVDGMIANRDLFVLHERNRAAFEQLHMKNHHDDHDDIERQLRRVLADGAIPLDSRVRMACSLGAVTLGVMISGEAFVDVPAEELSAIIRAAMRDLLGTAYPPLSASGETRR
jgi:AcrR family transcriptional regulator